MDLEIVTLAERPQPWDVFWAMDTSWVEFMKHDPIGNSYYACLEELFLEHVLVALDGDGRIVAKAHSAPFQLPDGELPDAGWDFALRSAVLTPLWGETPNAVTAVEIAIVPELQGTGLSAVMLTALRDNAARLGFAELLAPVRPNGKTDPHEPMQDYAFRTRDEPTGENSPVWSRRRSWSSFAPWKTVLRFAWSRRSTNRWASIRPPIGSAFRPCTKK